MRLSSLSHGSDKGVLTEILRGNWLEARNSLALRHSFLIGRRRITRRRVFVDGDRHFLGAIAIRIDDPPGRFGIGDCGQVAPRTRFARYFRTDTIKPCLSGRLPCEGAWNRTPSLNRAPARSNLPCQRSETGMSHACVGITGKNGCSLGCSGLAVPGVTVSIDAFVLPVIDLLTELSNRG